MRAGDKKMAIDTLCPVVVTSSGRPSRTRSVQWAAMPSRVAALLVALVLLLSGWTTQARAMAFAPAAFEQATEATQRCADGAAGDLSADDRQAPEQANPEGAGDLPALLAAGPQARHPALTMAMPRPEPTAKVTSADLDGPHRPPRAALPQA
jgi:hypothetical protein